MVPQVSFLGPNGPLTQCRAPVFRRGLGVVSLVSAAASYLLSGYGIVFDCSMAINVLQTDN